MKILIKSNDYPDIREQAISCVSQLGNNHPSIADFAFGLLRNILNITSKESTNTFAIMGLRSLFKSTLNTSLQSNEDAKIFIDELISFINKNANPWLIDLASSILIQIGKHKDSLTLLIVKHFLSKAEEKFSETIRPHAYCAINQFMDSILDFYLANNTQLKLKILAFFEEIKQTAEANASSLLIKKSTLVCLRTLAHRVSYLRLPYIECFWKIAFKNNLQTRPESIFKAEFAQFAFITKLIISEDTDPNAILKASFILHDFAKNQLFINNVKSLTLLLYKKIQFCSQNHKEFNNHRSLLPPHNPI